jgi:hypothetical protein
MKTSLRVFLTAAFLSSPALAQTTPAPEPTPAPVPTPVVAAVTKSAETTSFGISLTAGLNPGILSFALDYDLTDRINLRFGVSPSPQVLELDASYAFRTTPDWRVYGVLGVAYRFSTSPEAWSRVVGTLGVGLETRFFLFLTSSNPPPIWNRIEFGLSSLDETRVGYYSYPGGPQPVYPGPGVFFRYGTVIRF